MGLGVNTYAPAAAILSIAIAWHFYVYFDWNKTVYISRPGHCQRVVPIEAGSEDIALLPGGTAIITSGLRYLKAKGFENITGKLFIYRFSDEASVYVAHETKILWNEEKTRNFIPHGIKAYTTETGEVLLYVVNHEPDGDAIEIMKLDVEKGVAEPIKTIKHKLMNSVNNLAILGPDRFYMSNDIYFKNAFLRKLQFLLPMFNFGNIVLYDNGDVSVVDKLLPLPNGLDIDEDVKLLFVALSKSKQLLVYDISNPKVIKKIQSIDLGAVPDNLFYDKPRKSVWIGAHPLLYKIFIHLSNPRAHSTSPSIIFEVRFRNGFNDYTIHSHYSDTGEQLTGSSVAVRYENRILIGSIYDKLILCDKIDDNIDE